MHKLQMLVGDYSDLLILIFYNAAVDSSHQIYFRTEVKVGARKLPWCWNMNSQSRLYVYISARTSSLPIHALFEFGTTSNVFVIGKSIARKHLRKSASDFNFHRIVHQHAVYIPQKKLLGLGKVHW